MHLQLHPPCPAASNASINMQWGDRDPGALLVKFVTPVTEGTEVFADAAGGASRFPYAGAGMWQWVDPVTRGRLTNPSVTERGDGVICLIAVVDWCSNCHHAGASHA